MSVAAFIQHQQTSTHNVRLTEALLRRVILLKPSFAIENASGTYVDR